MPQGDRSKKPSRWRWVRPAWLIAALLAGLSIGLTYTVGGIAAAISVAATLLTALFAIWNPLKPGPSPSLMLKVGDEEVDRVILGAYPALDVEALVAELVQLAREREPPRDGTYWAQQAAMGGKYREPTEEERAEFAQTLADYETKCREWLTQIETRFRDASWVFEAELIAHNPAREDARDARIRIHFPPGFSEAGKGEGFPKPPSLPAFPLKLTGIAMMQQFQQNLERAGRWSPVAMGVPVAWTPAPISLWDARYSADQDGLVVSYAEQPIRHKDPERAGPPFRVRASRAGTYEAEWSVHASNLGEPRRGVFAIEVREPYPQGTPIRTLTDLRPLVTEPDGGDAE